MNTSSTCVVGQVFMRKLSFYGYIRLMSVMAILFVAACVFPGCSSDESDENASPAAESSSQTMHLETHHKVTAKILLVHSYHTGYPWVDGITRGVRMSLSGSNVDLQIFYMDTQRQTSEEWKIEAGRRAREVVDEWKPDVIIAADDNAQKYFVTTFPESEQASQFVFCGVNAEPAEYGYPAANVTGVLERPHFETSFDMLAKIQPKVKRIAFITDNSPTSKGVITHLRSLKMNYEVISIDAPDTFAQWQEAVEQGMKMADALAVFNYHTVQQSNSSQRMVPAEVMRWTAENCNIPIIGFQIFTVDDGALCGYLESAVEHGMKAGGMAMKIVEGTPAGDIPLITALEGQSMLNLITARRLGIRIPAKLIAQTDVVIGK